MSYMNLSVDCARLGAIGGVEDDRRDLLKDHFWWVRGTYPRGERRRL
jgi:hypothetical protein